MTLAELIRRALDAVTLTTTAWEDDEDIVLLNNEPVGGTVSRRCRVDLSRWWVDETREKLAAFIVEHIFKVNGQEKA